MLKFPRALWREKLGAVSRALSQYEHSHWKIYKCTSIVVDAILSLW